MSLKIRNLKKSFSSHLVIDGIDLEVSAGEILFVLGRSGTGKSVLLKNIVGLMKPDSGEIWVDGENVCDFDESEFFRIRKKCGMVFQHPALFDSMSVFDNVAFGLRRHFGELPRAEITHRVLKFLNLVGLSGIERKYPQDISYGMQKRVSLARTVAIEPNILLFDEPTTGLDPVTTNSINSLIAELSHTLKTTSVVVSHDIHCAFAIADRIAILDKGQVVALGKPAEIRTSKNELVCDFLKEIAI
jgi:phospholipid/cholesterol/gamma-HCH transport system ATP-binding protein